jgi:ATP-dependent protease ClpP protease subunit
MVIFNNDTQTEEEEEISEHQAAMVMAAIAGGPEGPEPNTIGLVGDLNEESAQEIYHSLLQLNPNTLGLVGDLNEESAQEIYHSLLQLNGGSIFPNPRGEEDKEEEDIHFLISTGGGAVYDMFGIIDMMSIVKRRRDSAGVPLLASGTKGKRFVTRNARIMMHRCSAGNMGTTADMKASHDEMRLMEDQMVQVEAIEMGLADEII